MKNHFKFAAVFIAACTLAACSSGSQNALIPQVGSHPHQMHSMIAVNPYTGQACGGATSDLPNGTTADVNYGSCDQIGGGTDCVSTCASGGSGPGSYDPGVGYPGNGAANTCVAQENFLVDIVDAFMERYFPDVASGAATIEDTFVSTEKLAQSFDDHGAELGITSEEVFAKTANSMLIGAMTDQPGLQIAQIGEQIYIYNSQTQAIGVYNNLGQTITMFKSSSTYFYNQIAQGGGAQITSAGLRGFYAIIGGHVPGRSLC